MTLIFGGCTNNIAKTFQIECCQIVAKVNLSPIYGQKNLFSHIYTQNIIYNIPENVNCYIHAIIKSIV